MAGYVKLRKRVPITMKRLGTNISKLTPIDVPFPLPGLHLERPRDLIPAGAAVNTDGVILRRGTLERMSGTILLGSSPGLPIMMATNYLTSAGVLDLIIGTTQAVVKYGVDWTLIPKNPAGNMGGGSSDLFWSTQIGSDLLFSQGVDQVYRYSGGSDFAILNANCPAALFGKGHQGRLLLANTVESAINYPYRVRWNVIDSIADWTGAGSGYIDLDDKSDAVMSIGLLNDYPVIFKETSIAVGNRTGQISPAYEFLERDPINGTRCPHAVVNIGDHLAYIGEDDIYVFDLNKSTSIGEPVRSRLFDELNPQYRSQCIGYLVEELDEVRFSTPNGSSTYNDYEWIWHRKDNTWNRRHRGSTCVTRRAVSSSPTWNSLSSTTWNSMMTRWGSGSLQPTATRIVHGTYAGSVYDEVSSVRSKNGEAFESLYELGDIKIDQSKYSGISYIELRYKDVGVPCSMSIGTSNDGGRSWTEDTRSLRYEIGSGKILRTYFFNIKSGETVSIRLYVNSATAHFEVTGIRLWMSTVGK